MTDTTPLEERLTEYHGRGRYLGERQGARSEQATLPQEVSQPTLPTTPELEAVPAASGWPPMQTTAVAIVVAPENYEQVVAEVPADKLPALIWWLDEVIRRANAAKKCALVEAAMAMERMELTDPRIEVNGHRYVLRQDDRIAWRDLGALLGMLETVHGIPGNELRSAVSEAKVTVLRAAAMKIADPELRADALESIEQARIKVPTQLALIDLDSEWRKRRS